VTKVLLAEDNAMNRDMLSRRLTRNGFEVVEAVNGEEAAALAGREAPDIILMDLSMPVMDGWEATRLLKDREQTRAIPVVALTAHAIKADRDRALAAGCDEVITKPFNFDELLEIVEKYVA